MKVIAYLKQKALENINNVVLHSYPPEFHIKQLSIQGLANQAALECLTNDLAIKVKSYPVYNQQGAVQEHTLHVLNYDQIESQKSNSIVMECRGLILDSNFNIVSRSMDRFFNLGEQPDTQSHIEMSKATCYEKVDGSLIKIYNWKGKWYISTRGTAYAESTVNGFDLTFKDLVLKALKCPKDGVFQSMCHQYLDPFTTYICEITSMENRVVRSYQGYKLYYLAARDNLTSEYRDGGVAAIKLGCVLPRQYSFNSVEHCIEASKNLPDLEEGYVLYQDEKPVAKIKSPAYVAVHAIRGEGLTPKRLMQLVLNNDVEEYVKYYPEDEQHFVPYQAALTILFMKLLTTYEETKNIDNQKEFAMKVKDTPYSAVLFLCKREGTEPIHTFHQQSELHKMRMLEAFV